MKRSLPPNSPDRFRGSLRHYHRSCTRPNRTWDEWIDGKPANTRFKHWLKFLAFLVAALTLGGVLVGLFIELR